MPEDFGFLPLACEPLRIAARHWQHLDRDVPIERHLARSEYATRPAASNSFQKLIPRQLRLRRRFKIARFVVTISDRISIQQDSIHIELQGDFICECRESLSIFVHAWPVAAFATQLDLTANQN